MQVLGGGGKQILARVQLILDQQGDLALLRVCGDTSSPERSALTFGREANRLPPRPRAPAPLASDEVSAQEINQHLFRFACSTYSVFFDRLSLRGCEWRFAARSDSC